MNIEISQKDIQRKGEKKMTVRELKEVYLYNVDIYKVINFPDGDLLIKDVYEGDIEELEDKKILDMRICSLRPSLFQENTLLVCVE